jgi:hypothetical protein
MDSYMTSNGFSFTATWIIFKNHLLEVGLIQNRETMALRMLTIVDLFYSIMCEDPCGNKLIELAFGRGPDHIRLHTTLDGPWPHYMMSEVCWGRTLDTFVWALTISWSRLLIHVWSGPYYHCVIEHIVWGRKSPPPPSLFSLRPPAHRGYYFEVKRPQVRGWVGLLKAFNIQVIC